MGKLYENNHLQSCPPEVPEGGDGVGDTAWLSFAFVQKLCKPLYSKSILSLNKK